MVRLPRCWCLRARCYPESAIVWSRLTDSVLWVRRLLGSSRGRCGIRTVCLPKGSWARRRVSIRVFVVRLIVASVVWRRRYARPSERSETNWDNGTSVRPAEATRGAAYTPHAWSNPSS